MSFNDVRVAFRTKSGASEMKNMINYVMENGHSFESKKFNAVDSLVLSQLAYLNFDGVVPGIADITAPVSIQEVVAVENPDRMFQNVRESKNNRLLLFAFTNSPRFRDTKLVFFVNQIDGKAEKQFSAITYLLSDGSAYIAYRGTDSTFVGWKEDFNMAFISPVPSQKEGVAYLNAVADRISCPLIIGGHSKGGNIAVYSAIHCRRSVQNRIMHIFSHDGPGFRDEVFQSDGYFIVKDRINKTLPQSSIIGMLLQHQENYSVVKSNRIWLMQHDPFSWLIDGDDFLYIPSITKSALYMNGTLNQWVNSYDDQKRELFVNTLFQIIQATNATTFYDLTGDWQKRAYAILGAMRGIDDETRKFLFQTIRSLFVLAVKNIREIKKLEITS
ncbi:MAG TPA: DUF2974 domain-containing protein [Candidatus Avimonas sp.]|jgi:hypothetical protein|nr:DUF2974 domain-containing protein [Candidatus Avimonas sp.]